MVAAKAERRAVNMLEHPIEGLMKMAMESIKAMVDVNTVVSVALC